MTLVVAHRGASEAAVGNTIEAFHKARELGADWVEFDVRRTADGVAVVHHDVHLADGRRVNRVNADALPSDVPSLVEALDACEGMGVVVEIKNLPGDPDFDDQNMVALAVAGVVSAYCNPKKVFVSSFDVGTISAVKQAEPSIPIALVCGITDPASAVARATAYDMAGIHVYDSVVDPNLVRRSHEVGLEVFVWTVNDAARMAELASMGVDGILTDVPDVARAVLDEAAS